MLYFFFEFQSCHWNGFVEYLTIRVFKEVTSKKKKSDSILCRCIWFSGFIINVVITSFLLLNSRDEFIMYKHESLCPRGIQCKLTPSDPGYHLLHRLPFSIFLCFFVQVVYLVALSTGAKYVSFTLDKTECWISMR